MSIITSRTNENGQIAFINEKRYSFFYRISLVVNRKAEMTFQFFLYFNFHNHFLYLLRTVNLHTRTMDILWVKHCKHTCFNNQLGSLS